MGKEQAENVPTIKLELTLGQEKAIFQTLYYYLIYEHHIENEVFGGTSPEYLRRIEDIRSVMPQLAKDVNFNPKSTGNSPLDLMKLGLSDLVKIEELQEIRNKMKEDYEGEKESEKKKEILYPLSRVIMETADYFIKKKQSENKK